MESNRALKKNHPTCSFLALFTSCVIRQAVPSQNIPCFTDKKQFEGGISGGIAEANVNLAYSPVKYLSVEFNAYSSLTSKYATTFNNQLEGAIGAYFPAKRFILGMNAGLFILQMK